jgi:hypothetical protein
MRNMVSILVWVRDYLVRYLPHEFRTEVEVSPDKQRSEYHEVAVTAPKHRHKTDCHAGRVRYIPQSYAHIGRVMVFEVNKRQSGEISSVKETPWRK